MALSPVIPRGRPHSASGTVRVLKNGQVRLSPDLCIGGYFKILVDVKQKKIVFARAKSGFGTFKVSYSNGQAKSGMVSGISAFRLLGLDVREYVGIYSGYLRNGKVEIDLRCKIF
jgi:hypothetical protein